MLEIWSIPHFSNHLYISAMTHNEFARKNKVRLNQNTMKHVLLGIQNRLILAFYGPTTVLQ